MPTTVGPNTFGEENLVFGYDLGDTSNSYKGEPAVNKVTNAATFNGGWATYDNGNDGTFITEFGTTGYQMVNRGSWNGIYQNFNLGASGTYTFSAWFKYLGGAASPNGGTVYISNYGGGDTAAGVNKDLIGQWQRVSKTVSVTSPGNVYFYIISYGGTYGGDKHSWQVTMPQIELNSHATPFVNGTRSATQGLVDLTGNSTIDLSNVSFDSNAQMTFDGSNDYASLGTVPLTSGASTYTIEAVFRADSTKTQVIWEQNSSGVTQHQRACMILLSSGVGGFNGQSNDFHSAVPYSTGVWYHWVITVNKNAGTNPIKVYVNGSLYAQGDSSTGASNLNVGTYGAAMGYKLNASGEYFDGDIKLVKVYNRVLTSAEIASNYKAIKGRFNI